MKTFWQALFLFGVGAALAAPAWAAEQPLNVVTTLSSFADLAEQVGGDRVKTRYIASPRFNPHFIEPRPSDVLKVKRADLFIHAGLDLELWRWPLVDAAGNPEVRHGGPRELDLSTGVRLLEVPDRAVTRAEGDIHLYGNPHYWLDPENLKTMARSIAGKLSQLDPSHAAGYERRLKQFLAQLEGKITEWKQIASGLRGKEAVAYHNEWPYLTEFLGMKVEQFLEPKPGIPPTPKQLAFLGGYMKAHNVPVIIQGTFVPRAAGERLAKETGARLVVLCQNVKEKPECSDAVTMLDHNIRTLAKAFGNG